MARWFESVAIAQERARRRLPESVYSALLAGSEKGVSYQDNVNSFSDLGFAPHVAGASPKREQSTTVLGQEISLPVLISPTGVQAVHPAGEVAVARAAVARGTLMGLSSFASRSMEEVVRTGARTLVQMYWMGDRDFMSRFIGRAKAAGAVGLIVTLDWTFTHSRDWGSPHIPQTMSLREQARHAPEALRHPRWLASYLRTGRLPRLTTPNLKQPGQRTPTFFGAYGQWMGTPPPSWDDLAWLRQQWDGPFLLKGVCRVDDAIRAADAGFSAISVSNHGGNNLDTTPAPIRALPAIVDAVGGRVEVLLDGGIRRGGDVVKALALGARAVMIGRAYLWGLAAAGQAGVENVLDIMRAGVDSALLGLGRASVHDLVRADVVVPPGFERRLGAG
jgi:heme/flavin dehydrogenase (mycofactocin system)